MSNKFVNDEYPSKGNDSKKRGPPPKPKEKVRMVIPHLKDNSLSIIPQLERFAVSPTPAPPPQPSILATNINEKTKKRGGRRRKPSSNKETMNNLHPSILSAINIDSKSAFLDVINKFEENEKTKINNNNKNVMNDNKTDDTNYNIKYKKYAKWSEEEYDDLIDAAKASNTKKLKSTNRWLFIKKKMRSGRSVADIKREWEKLVRSDSKTEYRHSDFCNVDHLFKKARTESSDKTS